MGASGAASAGAVTRACSVAKFTAALTPSSLLSRFWIRAAQLEHVIPPMARSTSWVSAMVAHLVDADRRVVLERPRDRPDPEADGERDDEGHSEQRESDWCAHAPSNIPQGGIY